MIKAFEKLTPMNILDSDDADEDEILIETLEISSRYPCAFLALSILKFCDVLFEKSNIRL